MGSVVVVVWAILLVVLGWLGWLALNWAADNTTLILLVLAALLLIALAVGTWLAIQHLRSLRRPVLRLPQPHRPPRPYVGHAPRPLTPPPVEVRLPFVPPVEVEIDDGRPPTSWQRLRKDED